MSFRRYANAIVSQPNIEFDRWMEEIRVNNQGVAEEKQIMRVAKTVFRKCDPKQYLLSHATIVASVDCYEPKGTKIGKFLNRGIECERRWKNFRIKPECQNIINNNGDAWERSLLLATYRTFIGAPNYLEHIQIPELSKGFIVDAIARDLGETCYVDILVATDRKHKMLVSDILSENIRAMSMGCISLFTICNKCGNVAVDDSQLCPCILYDGKRTKFLDENNVEHKLAELIGHVSVPNSNQFIEGSWVRNPAFEGAQRRNILNPESSAVASRLEDAAAVYEIRRDEMDLDGISHAASVSRAAQDDEPEEPGGAEKPEEEPTGDVGDEPSVKEELGEFDVKAEGSEAEGSEAEGSEAEGSEAEGSEEDKPPSEDHLQKLIDQAQELLMENLVKGLAEKTAPKPEDVGTVTPGLSDANYNDSMIGFEKAVRARFLNKPRLIRWACSAYKVVHFGGRAAIRKSGMSPKDLIVLSWIEDVVRARPHPAALYEIAMAVGPSSLFPSEESYLAACGIKVGRRLASNEKSFLLWKGRIGSLSVNF